MTEKESARIENFKRWYEQNQEKYKQTAEYVLEKIMIYIREQKFNIAYSCARAKSIDSVYNKAKKMTERDGVYILKYTDPQNEIMDFAGVRIIVYLTSEMKIITDAVERLFSNNILYDDSENKIDLLGENKVGYLSIHYVVTVDTDENQFVHLKGKKCEIQIRTVLQDAWAQVFHDRLYKGNVEDARIRRRTNLLAGNLELIDSQIDEIVKYYDSKNGNLSKKAYQELLNEKITDKSLSDYCDLLLNGRVERYYSYEQVKTLLGSFGIETIRELNYCVNDGFIRELRDINITLTIDRLVRYIIFLYDYKKFFSKLDNSKKFIIDRQIYDLLDRFVDIKEICKQYNNLTIREENIDG